jgi:hypothetical protein
MYKQAKWNVMFFTLILTFSLSSVSYAMTVSAQTSSKEVYALGFQTNGKDYGGAGTSYSRSNLSPGMYSFGIRIGGLLIGAKDVPCPIKGKRFVMLNKDTTAILNYNGRSCSANIR